jgi:hypothetical protein
LPTINIRSKKIDWQVHWDRVILRNLKPKIFDWLLGTKSRLIRVSGKDWFWKSANSIYNQANLMKARKTSTKLNHFAVREFIRPNLWNWALNKEIISAMTRWKMTFFPIMKSRGKRWNFLIALIQVANNNSSRICRIRAFKLSIQ